MISVQNLIYSYPKTETPTVKEVSFEVKDGEIFGFLGPSGAGKSTTQKILTKLLKNYEGEVFVKNGTSEKELREWKNDFYNKIGVGFELPNHYSKLSALENLQFFASFYELEKKNLNEKLMQLLESVGLAKDAKKKVQDFSKGMKMRLNFVRALIHNPEILFLDEPTSGLDPANGKIIKDIIRNLQKEGKTIILTTHHMNDAEQLCDRVAFMVDGKIPLIDSPKNLKEKYGKRTLKIEYSHQERRESKLFDLENLGQNEDFLKLINQNYIQSIHSQEATLEDIFIEVTGKKLI
ncbi:ATP-binding cassette domain-containing protein [Bernardetia sp.]|uniref:ABC transporter ATP-binding protein n=1 Tax=Bernardetia sp. TaxID=1937974 RepID=UPI0025BD68F6|nr:ABC transporter ATP-binding protein [Bernardetia sp.]